MGLLNRLAGRSSKNSRLTAKARLKHVLAQERHQVSPPTANHLPAKPIESISAITTSMHPARYGPVAR